MKITDALTILGLSFSDLPSITINVPDVVQTRLDIVGAAPWCLFVDKNQMLCLHQSKKTCEHAGEMLNALEFEPGERCLHSSEVKDLIN
jgi:hypothetical protein